jgi:hypothetical protein
LDDKINQIVEITTETITKCSIFVGLKSKSFRIDIQSERISTAFYKILEDIIPIGDKLAVADSLVRVADTQSGDLGSMSFLAVSKLSRAGRSSIVLNSDALVDMSDEEIVEEITEQLANALEFRLRHRYKSDSEATKLEDTPDAHIETFFLMTKEIIAAWREGRSYTTRD